MTVLGLSIMYCDYSCGSTGTIHYGIVTIVVAVLGLFIMVL